MVDDDSGGAVMLAAICFLPSQSAVKRTAAGWYTVIQIESTIAKTLHPPVSLP